MKDIWSSSLLDPIVGSFSDDEDDDVDNDTISVCDDIHSNKSHLSREQTELNQIDISRREEDGIELKENPWTKAVSNYATRRSRENRLSLSCQSNRSHTTFDGNPQNPLLPSNEGDRKGRPIIQFHDLNSLSSFEKFEPLKATLTVSPKQKEVHMPVLRVVSNSNERLYSSHHGHQKNSKKKKRTKIEKENLTKKVVFGKIPKNIQPTPDFPIVQGLYNQGRIKQFSKLQTTYPSQKTELNQTNSAIRRTTNIIENDDQIRAVSDLSDDSIEEPVFLYSNKRNIIDLTNSISPSPPKSCSSTYSPACISTQNGRTSRIGKAALSNQEKVLKGQNLKRKSLRESRFESKYEQIMYEDRRSAGHKKKKSAPERPSTHSDTSAPDRPNEKCLAFIPLLPSSLVGHTSEISSSQALSLYSRSSLSAQPEDSSTSSEVHSSSPCTRKDLSRSRVKPLTRYQSFSRGSKKNPASKDLMCEASSSDQQGIWWNPSEIKSSKMQLSLLTEAAPGRARPSSISMPMPIKTITMSGRKITLCKPPPSSSFLNQGGTAEVFGGQEDISVKL